ncbi:MAG TPA: hypothetical protein VEQ87_16030 [Burkholderiales bacterium]|nr:hypothetical protein [Burkholderiales bacterium]
MRRLAEACRIALLIAVVTCGAAWGQTPNLAPGFTTLPKGAKLVIMPADIEIFSISAGGVAEPRADWTEAAIRNFKAAAAKKKAALGLTTVELDEKDADEFTELNNLHAAIARAISMHHFGPSSLQLPTKEGKLEWSLGDAAQEVKKATGADYAVFSWLRDAHASAERQAAMVAIAILSLGRAVPGGGRQTAYASLVDLNTGRILWFNRLQRDSGNVKDAEHASETIDTLFGSFPIAR